MTGMAQRADSPYKMRLRPEELDKKPQSPRKMNTRGTLLRDSQTSTVGENS